MKRPVGNFLRYTLDKKQCDENNQEKNVRRKKNFIELDKKEFIISDFSKGYFGVVMVSETILH